MTPPAIDALVFDGLSAPYVTSLAPDLETLQDLIGGIIEPFGGETTAPGVGVVAWSGYCDEEGKIKGLPINHPATRFAQRNGWYALNDVLCGPVVFLGEIDDEGNETPVPPLLVERLTEA